MTAVAWVAALALAASPEQILETAQRYLGVRYKYGARNTNGVDCSGFVQKVYAEHGIPLPRTSRDQASAGEPIDWDEVEAGDLLFFTESPSGGRINHVGIAMGGGKMIHASTGRGEVVIDDLTLRYYADRKTRARRVLGVQPTGEPAVTSVASAEPEPDDASALPPSIEPAPAASVSAITPHATPRLAPARTALGARAGVAQVEDEALLLAALVVSLRLEQLDLDLALQLPFVADVGGALAWRFDEAKDYLRILESFRLGRPDSRLYVEASRDLALTLGQGALVASSSPASGHRGHVALPTHAGFAITSRAVIGDVDAQLVLDDVARPHLIGARIGGAGWAALAVEGAADPQLEKGGVAIEGRLRLLERSTLTWSTDLTAAAVNTRETNGGLVAGTWVRHQGQAVELGARAAAHLRQPGFVPGVFDATYRASPERWELFDDVSAGDHERWGFELTATAAYTKRVSARVRYRHDAALGTAGEHAPARELEVQMALRDLYVASLSSYASLSATYLRPFDEPARQLLLAGARLRINDVVSLGAQMARRPPTSRHRELVSAFVDLTIELGL